MAEEDLDTQESQEAPQLWFEKIKALESADGEQALSFKYQHRKEANMPVQHLEFRVLAFNSPYDDTSALTFGLWANEGTNIVPIGVLYGMEVRGRNRQYFIAGSRYTLKEVFSFIDSKPVFHLFETLDNLHPDGQNGSDNAFEMSSDWRDGRLSQVFLGLSLELLARRGLKSVDFNDDKTITSTNSSVYTRYAEGSTYGGSTTVSTQLSQAHEELLDEILQ